MCSLIFMIKNILNIIINNNNKLYCFEDKIKWQRRKLNRNQREKYSPTNTLDYIRNCIKNLLVGTHQI